MKISFRQTIAETGISARDYNNPAYIKSLLAQYIQSPEWNRSYEKSSLRDAVYNIVKLNKSAVADTLGNIGDLETKKRFGFRGESDYIQSIPDEVWEQEDERIAELRAKGDYDTDNKYEIESREIDIARDTFIKKLEPVLIEFFKDYFRRQIISTFDKVYDMNQEQFEDFHD